MKKLLQKLINLTLSPELSPSQVDEGSSIPKNLRPVIWLLGKTAAGKTSLVRCLTGASDAEIGNGFQPCTRNSREFSFPADQPLIRFLDTRGLGEVDYDPSEDIEQCVDRSHAVLVVAKIVDPLQHDVARALHVICKSEPKTPITIVHTGADLVRDEDQRKRAIADNQQQFEQAAGRTLAQVTVSMPADALGYDAPGIVELFDRLAHDLPEAALLLLQDSLDDDESRAYLKVKSLVLKHAYAAGTADLAPIIGAVAAPSIQASLLRDLARHFGMGWNQRRLKEFLLALGMGVLARFGSGYLARQLTKLIPGVGQTVGAIASGSISFASTYALGRTAAYYLYHARHGKSVNQEQLRALYRDALSQAIRSSQQSKLSKESESSLPQNMRDS